MRVLPPKAGQGKAGIARLDLTLPSLTRTGWLAADLQHQQRLRIAAVQGQAPQLTFTPPAQAPAPIWQQLAAYVRRTDVDKLTLRNGEVRVVTVAQLPGVRQLNVTGTAIRIDSAAASDPQRIAYAQAWRADAGQLSTSFDGPFYKASSRRVYA